MKEKQTIYITLCKQNIQCYLGTIHMYNTRTVMKVLVTLVECEVKYFPTLPRNN